MYDVLRDNIGLLQPINEFNFPWSKKPTRWQRFKNFVGRNKGKMALGAGMLAGIPTGLIGKEYLQHRKLKSSYDDKNYQKDEKGYYKVDEFKERDGTIHSYWNRPRFRISNAFSLNDRDSVDTKDIITYPNGRTEIQHYK